MRWVYRITLLLALYCLPLRALDQGLFNAFKERVSSVLPQIEGWSSREKAFSFIDLIAEVKPAVCVEVGVFAGRSFFPTAAALKFFDCGVIFAVDAWDKLECIKYFDPVREQIHLDWWGNVNLNLIFIQYLNLLKRFKLSDYSVTLKMTSEEAALEITEEIDILHLDGNPTETNFFQDVLLYLPKVRQGGYIWINDTLSNHTQKALAVLIESCDQIKAIDGGNCLLFKKR